MRRAEPVHARTAEQMELSRVDGLLWLAVLLGPLGAFINTLFGFTIAHWVSQVASKLTGFLLDGFDMLLCVVGIGLALSLGRRFRTDRDDLPEHGRRYFMANLALLLAILSLVAVVFQTLNMVMLNPSD